MNNFSELNNRINKLGNRVKNFAPSVENRPNPKDPNDTESFVVTDSGTQLKLWNMDQNVLAIKGIIEFDKPLTKSDYKVVLDALGKFEAALASKGFNIVLNKSKRLEKVIGESPLTTEAIDINKYK